MDRDYVLEMLNVGKEFPGVKALQDVNFQLSDGEVHGLVGENGAGKSTLMKVLAGIYQHDSGEVIFNGKVQKSLTPKSVERLGIHFIHQERYIVPYLTVAETLFLGIEPTHTPLKLLRRKSLEKEANQMLREKVGVNIPGNKLVGELTVGEQQLLQVCRALLHEPRVIVFDEPTAVLAQREADQLFKIIRELRNKNIGIIYISHYFGEILDICDRITVLRNGTNVTTTKTNGLTIEDIVFMMSGKHIGEQFPEKNWKRGEKLLEVKGLTHKKHFQDVTFNVHKNEIVGITGLMGSGHSDIGVSIYDNADIIKGSITFKEKVLDHINPEHAVGIGMGYVPDDRRHLGIIQSMSVRENITLASLKTVSKGVVIKRSNEIEKVDRLIESLNIKTPDRETELGNLSGGNQQKVVMAKWLNSEAELYILNQPTAAVDVSAKAEIYKLIGQLAEQGAGILIISQDIQELVGLCDRILVMYRGKVIEEIDGKNTTTDEVMVSIMGGNINDAVSEYA
ncbi:sugar ABC transporter ATP-binding protein [Bacillus sp. Marseille-P3661]|uniref:sugar ABC transporter ATP-binding protein n=1 Tax=Bacillus sp. Marseille-P3661 TaxID=1936234 RepID=UPI000C81CC1A|nr:sugar ABC transporter ATP-binding protein [Bacillus sp. Marseille-P3661]